MKYLFLTILFNLTVQARPTDLMNPYCAEVKSTKYIAKANTLIAELDHEIKIGKSHKTSKIYTKDLDDKYKIKIAKRDQGSLICVNTIKKGKTTTHKIHLIQAADLPYITRL